MRCVSYVCDMQQYPTNTHMSSALKKRSQHRAQDVPLGSPGGKTAGDLDAAGTEVCARRFLFILLKLRCKSRLQVVKKRR